jgi:hypothetical protein
VLLRDNKMLAISPEGHYRGSGLDLERELVYLVQTAAGQSLLSPDEFGVQYGWKSDPEKVRLLRSNCCYPRRGNPNVAEILANGEASAHRCLVSAGPIPSLSRSHRR